ncbi:MAG TPA: hypothetical protein VGB77_11005 [Abditibacteriaceae bacterium]
MNVTIPLVELLIIAGIVWGICVNLRHQKSGDAMHCLQEGRVYEGLCLLANADRWPQITTYLKSKLPLPEENLRPRLLETVNQVKALRSAAQSTSTSLPTPLCEQILNETNEALDALWHTCQRLATVGRLEVDAQLLKHELETERAHLQQLSQATESAKIELARLNLSGGHQQIEDAARRFSQLGWAAGELRRLDDEMWSDETTSAPRETA